jgi:hypothetical protein
MKRIIYIFFASLVAVGIMVTSCNKKYLDEEVFSSYSPETLRDSLGFEASIVGLHNHLSTFFSYADQQGWPSVWQVGTDIAYATQPQGIEVPYYDYATLISTDGAASYTWSWAYRMINNANIIIKAAEDPELSGMSQANKDAIDGEARFFRAYAYNMLATLFGKVPLVTEPLAAPRTDFVRTSLDSVNAVIEEDLLFAAAHLPDIDNVKKSNGKSLYGRINKAAAQQLLAEAYLRMNKPAEAETQCNAIINSGKFHLITERYGVRASQPGDPFSDMFIYGNMRRNQGNMEAIWVMEQENPANVTGGITNNPQQRRNWGASYKDISGLVICDSLGGRGIGRMRLNNWVVYDLYDANDMRNSQWNLRRQYWYNDPASPKFGEPVPYTGADTLYKIAPHTTKWYEFNPNDVFGFAMIKDFILMRLGETYLLRAEAQFKQNKPDDAAASINELRTRAHAPLVSGADITLDFILDERVRELLGEENRRMTLMRTGTLVDRAQRLNTDMVNPAYKSAVNQLTGISARNLLMPIPQAEIDLNKDAVLEQNEGY